MTRGGGTIARIAVAIGLLCALTPAPALAQKTLNEALAGKAKAAKGDEKLLVEAGEIVYDNDKNTVSAVGDVHLYYQGRTLQADRVTYDRNTQRVFATGNARLTDADGTVATGDRFDLTEDFRDGFIDSLRVQRTQTIEGRAVTTRFSSPRAERIGGETIVFEKGTYTACEPCREHPERPPLWQVKAARIIHNNAERTVYYEDATIEFSGVPVAWVPYFSAPDATVKRKTGFLAPHVLTSRALGHGTSLPFFWDLAPNYDLTLTPTVLTRQGVLGQVEWRQRLLNGAYNIRAAGIFQQDKSAFLPSPFGAQEKNFRGSIETAGRFFINERWQTGWDIAAISDKWFFQNYHIKSESLSATYFRESTSTVFLTGKSESAFFDLHGYYFKGLSYTDWQKQQPVVGPVLDYNKRLAGPSAIGGEVTLDGNFTTLTRSEAYFQQTPRPLTNLFVFNPLGVPVGLFDTCTVFERGRCLLRGVGGSYSRASTEISWRRAIVDPLGQVWTPFASFRLDGMWVSPDTTGILNQFQPNYLPSSDSFLWRAMPAVGVDYRYPFVNTATGFGTHTIEPIAQIIVRPNETRIGRLPNEDAQSLIFDDTTIFEWNKFSGYDRVEGGVRANYGAKYTITTTDGAYADLLFGQSYQVAGRNSFEAGDLANTGLDSGLDKRASDYVGRFHLAPNANMAFTARTRFDEQTFGLKRLELTTTATAGPVMAAVTFAHYAPQPDLAIPVSREGLYTSLAWNVTPHWSVNGSILLDLSQHPLFTEVIPSPTSVKAPLVSIAGLSLGAQYKDECTTFGVVYSSTYNDPATGLRGRDQTVLLRLELRTLGTASLHQSISSSTTQDGIAQ